MTNYDILLEMDKTGEKEETVRKLSKSLALVCKKIIYRMNQEQDEHIEVSNFDLNDMQNDFIDFFSKQF